MLHNNRILLAALEEKGYSNTNAYAYLTGAMSIYLTQEQFDAILSGIRERA